MSQIKTVSATLIRKILVDDFKPAMLLATETGSSEDVAKARAAVDAINIDELDLLVDRINAVKELVLEQRNSKEAKAKAVLEAALDGSGFSSLEELLAAVGVGNAVSTRSKRVKATGDKSKNSYTVKIPHHKGVNKETKEYTIYNYQWEKNAIANDEVFQSLMKKNGNNIRAVLREYSDDYIAACDSEYDGIKFIVGTTRMNEEAQRLMNMWLDKQGDTIKALPEKEQRAAFREAVKIRA